MSTSKTHMRDTAMSMTVAALEHRQNICRLEQMVNRKMSEEQADDQFWNQIKDEAQRGLDLEGEPAKDSQLNKILSIAAQCHHIDHGDTSKEELSAELANEQSRALEVEREIHRIQEALA